jgi:hypothetical protein
MESKLTYCGFMPDEYGLFCEWCAGHGREPLKLEYLPATGIIVCQDDEPIVMLWVYFDDSTPVCFAERAITRPGLSMKEAGDGLCVAMEAAKECANARGVELMVLRAPKGMARYATRRLGFSVEESEVVNLAFRLIREEDLCLG